jgi:Flp pilus assembly pilin Flp
MRTGSDRGSSAVEFGLLLATLAIALVSAASLVGDTLRTLLASAVSMVGG